jgi:hypothetical protein
MTETAVAASEYPRETCRSCPALIIWAVTVNGKAMPVDAEPVDGGNVALRWTEGKVYAEVLSVTRQATRVRGTLRMSHHATCPQGGAWRKRRAAP